MKPRWILNLLLAALVIGLAALAYFKPAMDKPVGPPLTALASNSVTQIRIDRTGQTITLEKTDAGWRLTAPVRARANQFNIDSLLRVAAVTSAFQTAADASALATYGLDQPSVRLRLNDEDIAIGAMHPMRQQHYVRYRDTVHLIPSYMLAPALQNYSAFIDSRLLEDGRKLSALRLPTLRLVLQNGSWRREPHDEKISADHLNTLVAEWQNARALAVEKLSNKAPLAQVELSFDNGAAAATLKLDVLAYKPEFILARRDEGLEYHFPEEIGKRLLSLETGNAK